MREDRARFSTSAPRSAGTGMIHWTAMADAGSLLQVARWRERSVVTRARSVAPLRLLAPTSPGRAAWVYQSSLGGGFVGRDAIALGVEVEADARLFLTSQASSKVYRRAASRCELEVRVGDRGVLVAWPDPIACFAGAAFAQQQRVALVGAAGVILVDAWTAGRIAHGEHWAFRRLALRSELTLDGAPLVTEATLLDAAHGALAARMAGAQACASVIIAGAPFASAMPALVERIAARPVRDRLAISAWPWGGVIRIAAASSEALQRTTYDLIGALVRDALAADPFARSW